MLKGEARPQPNSPTRTAVKSQVRLAEKPETTEVARPEKRLWLHFTTFVFTALFRLYIVLHEVSSNAGRATFPTALFFCTSSLLPPRLKAGLSRALRCLCSAAQERDESSTELSSNTLLRVCVARARVGGVRSVVSHLLVLRCRVETGPGRSASGCWDC